MQMRWIYSRGTILSDNSSPGNSRITKKNAYGHGNHIDQYGRNVTIQPMHGNTGSNTFNQIQKQDAYGPGIHMDQYGRAVTVRPKY